MKESRCPSLVSLAGFLLTLLTAVSAEAATITVKSTADSGGACPGATCTLRQAIVNAGASGTVNFSLPANSTITLTSEIAISANVTISGPGANLLTVQRTTASNAPHFRIFSINSSANVAISGLTIANGSAEFGGGINNSGTLTLTSCTISGNAVSDSGMASSSLGGGIYNSGTATIARCTITGNTTHFRGGGIYNGNVMTIVNTTISGNSGIKSFTANTYGGGIYTYNGTTTITSSTISGNSASGPGGIAIASGTLKLTNTIIAKNTGGDIYGPVTSQGFNFLGNSSGATITATTGDQFGTSASPIDPMLGPLQDNGGPTKTHALLPDSSAIEAGNSTGVGTDQRGFSRPVDSPTIQNVGDGADIGAYEVQADTLPGCNNGTAVVTSNADGGPGSLRDVIATACADSTISFADNVRGVIDLTSDELFINKSLAINGPGADRLKVQRSATFNTPAFRIFEIARGGVIVTISGLTIANGNSPGGNGGGIYNNGSTLTLGGCTLSGNSTGSSAGGGGVFNAGGTLAVANSTIIGNLAGFGGGGINSSQGTTAVTGSTVSDNSTNGGPGGGIYLSGDSTTGTLTVTNSTISGNSASDTTTGFKIGLGGGIHNGGGTVTLTNSTISGNSAQLRGGGVNGNFISRNTIIALNTSPSGPDLYGALNSQGFNLIGNNSDANAPGQFSDQIGTPESPIDPLLDSLKDNGGPTLTRALRSGSPAIDKGDSSSFSTDQRGFPRPVDIPTIANTGDGGDIGAFEFGSSLPTPTPTATPTPTPTATPTLASQLLNLSTRKQVGTGDNVLIGGFIVVGTEDKNVILRALGPSLPVSDVLADPVLELHRADTTLLAANDNWKDTQESDISATGIPPSNDLESAIVASLPAKPLTQGGEGYTGVLAGGGGTVGIGLLEIFDLAINANSQLANISTRGFVGTDDDVLIGGFIPGPSDRLPCKVLVRALGPSLTGQGVSGALQDPVLELHDANGTLLTDDNWKDSQEAEISGTGIPPSDDRESAIVTTLPPSNSGYTAVVRGANNSTGVALVEVFGLP